MTKGRKSVQGSKPNKGLEPKKNNSVDDLSGDELKAYAAKVGISQRDINGLTEDRLRQNCKARILASMDDD
jgi:hypothetical protein